MMSPCLPPHNMPPIEHIREYSTLSKKKEEVEKKSPLLHARYLYEFNCSYEQTTFDWSAFSDLYLLIMRWLFIQ